MTGDLGDDMRALTVRCVPFSVIFVLALSSNMFAQADGASLFKANCVLCHGADGSGNTSAGKALKAKDLRSDEVQKESDAALIDAITKGKGNMPAFGDRIKPDEVKSLVAYVRALKK
jgi:mono/diheme cytochrome c family protein